jgi:hypothetical protein
MVKCSPTPGPGHVIPSAVTPAHDRRAHGLPQDLQGPMSGVLTRRPLPRRSCTNCSLGVVHTLPITGFRGSGGAGGGDVTGGAECAGGVGADEPGADLGVSALPPVQPASRASATVASTGPCHEVTFIAEPPSAWRGGPPRPLYSQRPPASCEVAAPLDSPPSDASTRPSRGARHLCRSQGGSWCPSARGCRVRREGR